MGKRKAVSKANPLLLFIKNNLKAIILIAVTVAIIATGLTVGFIVGRREVSLNGVKYTLDDKLGGYVASAVSTDIKYAEVQAKIDGVPVVALADEAFKDCSELLSLKLPDSIVKIGHNALVGCDKLKYNVSSGAKYLGNNNNPYLVLTSYSDTQERIALKLEDGVKIIAPRAFYGSEFLVTLIIPESTEIISDEAFANAASLVSPNAFARTITVARIEIAGATVNIALEIIVVLRVSFAMPSSRALFRDLTRKNTDCTTTKPITTNATAYINPLVLKSPFIWFYPPITF